MKPNSFLFNLIRANAAPDTPDEIIQEFVTLYCIHAKKHNCASMIHRGMSTSYPSLDTIRRWMKKCRATAKDTTLIQEELSNPDARKPRDKGDRKRSLDRHDVWEMTDEAIQKAYEAEDWDSYKKMVDSRMAMSPGWKAPEVIAHVNVELLVGKDVAVNLVTSINEQIKVLTGLKKLPEGIEILPEEVGSQC